jgi:hypothetical protein
MRTTRAYTSARILLLVVSLLVLYAVGARGLLLLALAFVISGIASFVLLSKQRDVMSKALATRRANRGQRGPGLRARLEQGARTEDAPIEDAPMEEGGEQADELQAADRGTGPAAR